MYPSLAQGSRPPQWSASIEGPNRVRICPGNWICLAKAKEEGRPCLPESRKAGLLWHRDHWLCRERQDQEGKRDKDKGAHGVGPSGGDCH
ncbi:hypothetical protein HU200_066441 [Digitaria exilis]|uniref:Uncharacterized protein n=1 Tax=Digitaria exilis TaxID=1010633 RepID=A0A835A277_9POAL|nr:hypothetical protein HU200_066441 [Digitaria exilis]